MMIATTIVTVLAKNMPYSAKNSKENTSKTKRATIQSFSIRLNSFNS
jgi:hypothetical protein